MRKAEAWKAGMVGAFVCFGINLAAAQRAAPPGWSTLVPVAGQSQPVPQAWLEDEEARIAHSLTLPQVVPTPVPYDFKQPWTERLWLDAHRKASVRYFHHLCRTEAGEWIVRKAEKVEGLYFARPQRAPTTDVMTDAFGPEMPWIQRVFMISGDSAKWHGLWFIQPPIYNYRFVEQPRREDADWQKQIDQPYIRLFGYTKERDRDRQGRVLDSWGDKDPMQVVGIAAPTARFGYTWRGIKRDQDREHKIAGGEVLIYDMQTREVLAVRRQFLIASHNPRGRGNAIWEVAAGCPQLPAYAGGGEFKQFAFDVLHTIEQSSTRRK